MSRLRVEEITDLAGGAVELPGFVGGGSGITTSTTLYGTAKAWARFDSQGVTSVAFNCSVVKNSRGEYTVTFDTPMPTANYVITTAPSNYGGSQQASPGSVTANGFDLRVANDNNESVNNGAYFVVHDNEPAEVALTTSGDVINYSGTSAWGNVAADGTLRGGLNCTIEKINLAYRIRFNTPMPNNRYAVTFGSNNTNTQGKVVGQSAASMDVQMRDVSTDTAQDRAFYFAVFATDSIPPKGGTGTDAWGDIASNGNINAGFNISSANNTSAGLYQITFITPMPTSSYAVVCTDDRWDYEEKVINKTTNGFQVAIRSEVTQNSENSNFSFVVNATNATLPATLTQDMLVLKSGDTMTGALNLPDSASRGPGGQNAIPSKEINPYLPWAFGCYTNGATANFVGATITDLGTGLYRIDFNETIGNTKYTVLLTIGGDSGTRRTINYDRESTGNKTTSSFIVRIKDSIGDSRDGDFSFVVYPAYGL